MSLVVASQVELIPGYRLIQRLGQGGFGEVWKAEAPGGMLKAVKIVHGTLLSSADDATHLTQELKALHRVKTVRHPFILSLERFDIVDGRLIIVSELADRTLADRLQDCRAQGLPGIPREELLRYLAETAEALDLMNVQYNLQHLDIKPQNLFLLHNHIKVGDFGLVKDLEGMSAQITSGVTAVYAAPETFEGMVSRFSDQYNLAIVFQELLTGQLPYDGISGRQLMMQHVTRAPNLEPLPALDQPVVARALSKKPEARYPSCLDFVRALRQAEAAAAQVAGPSSPPSSVPAKLSDTPSLPFSTPVDPSERPTTFIRGKRPAGEDGLAAPRPEEHPVFATAGLQPAGEPTPPKPLTFIHYEPPAPPAELPETTGDGVLMPALVVGLGGLGREVLQQFRKALRKRGPTESWPHVGLLNVDTDPEGYEQATREPDTVLSPGEMLVTPFQRPSHYLKHPRERDQLAQWLPLNLLTSMPRGQTSAGGWRALGRLAFVSSGAAVAARLREALEACCDEKTLQDVVRRTALGLRSTRPRAYVVTSLTGGTGSGMFLDFAWALRRELQQLGHPGAEVIGVLLVPTVERTAEGRGVANGFAALAELKYFAAAAAAAAASGNGQDGGKPRGPKLPFDRCVLLPLPTKVEGATALHDLTALAGDFLCRELTSPLGRIADEGRAALRPPSGPGMICQTFGAYWFSVPRRPLLQKVAQHIGDRLVRRWNVRDPKALDQAIKTWVADQLNKAKLSAASLGVGLQEACAATLGQTPSVFFDAHVGRWGKGGPMDLAKKPEALKQALEELEQLLGPSQRQPSLDLPSPPAAALREASRVVTEQAGARLSELSLSALAEPHFRFACKEEAVQVQLGLPLGEAARFHKKASETQYLQALDVLRQIPPLHEKLRAGGLFRGRAKARAAAGMVEILAHYLAARWESMVALALSELFQELQGNLHQYRRPVDCCHKQIGQFLKTFGDSAAMDPRADLGLGRYLLPFGCRTLEDAVTRILDSLPAAEEDALHGNVWNLIRTTLRDNVHVCTAPVSLFRGLREGIDREVAKVAEDSLGRAHAASVYLEQQAERSDADDDLAGAFEQARPELAGSPSVARKGFCIVAVPPGPEGERFRALVRHALPKEPMLAAASTDDIIFYREQPHLSLTELPQLGPAAREIYQQALTSEQYGPHSRTDIVAW